MRTQFTVEKMMCGGCQANVEKALDGISGIESVSVDLENKSVTIEGDIDVASVAQVISDAGYPASIV